jgi:hypothetical protein
MRVEVALMLAGTPCRRRGCCPMPASLSEADVRAVLQQVCFGPEAEVILIWINLFPREHHFIFKASATWIV